jgi:hypothetical protein
MRPNNRGARISARRFADLSMHGRDTQSGVCRPVDNFSPVGPLLPRLVLVVASRHQSRCGFITVKSSGKSETLDFQEDQAELSASAACRDPINLQSSVPGLRLSNVRYARTPL